MSTEQAADLGHGRKAIDPLSVATLVVSIPAAAVAVADLADRIHKRRRATEIIDNARQSAAQHVTVLVTFGDRPIELKTLLPDQLLDLTADGEAD